MKSTRRKEQVDHPIAGLSNQVGAYCQQGPYVVQIGCLSDTGGTGMTNFTIATAMAFLGPDAQGWAGQPCAVSPGMAPAAGVERGRAPHEQVDRRVASRNRVRACDGNDRFARQPASPSYDVVRELADTATFLGRRTRRVDDQKKEAIRAKRSTPELGPLVSGCSKMKGVWSRRAHVPESNPPFKGTPGAAPQYGVCQLSASHSDSSKPSTDMGS